MKQKPIEDLEHKMNVETALRCIWAIKDRDQFYFNEYGKMLIEKCIHQKVTQETRLNVIEFGEWLRTFDSLTKSNKQWSVESQVTTEQLFNHFLEDRTRWLNNNKDETIPRSR